MWVFYHGLTPTTSAELINEVGQVHENDPISVVLTCSAALPKSMGAMHPAGSLYEKPVNIMDTIRQHEKFKELLRENGATVLDVKQVLSEDTNKFVNARLDLENLAASMMTYQLDPTCDDRLLNKDDRYYLGNAYKAKVLSAMSASQLVDVILTRPTVTLTPSLRDTGFTAAYQLFPLSNVVFTRDQQITTKKGVVMCNLSSKQRKAETEVMSFVWKKLGVKVIGEIPDPGRLEGGDFFALGDSCMIGVGLRTNMEAIQYMMDEDLLGYNKIQVIKDELEVSQDRMHLDTYFSILDDHTVCVMEECLGEDSNTRRYVDEYVRKDENSSYEKVQSDVEFAQFLKNEGYGVIHIPGDYQLKYGCNCLNLGNGNVLCVHLPTARMIAASPLFKGKIQYLDFDGITALYGAAHCASQVVRRIPRAGTK
ncbi:hypothetical protein SARC_02050 [Sphaeroforma arctica JP610]|uniref:Arginine deiminase n=1 Tax=Sphaeroforma arctica JP610 TaxID=667725 RepID=A0A0L0G9T1_9EUKA|nr:hypothetical protein SARC_02050 [Sphaeroforma arctica JP610]KNC85787.1 hypothetical protein SARC_02050 [Sphaeroforma arctica JP610]|eukprot:XP_014159689.1 hypothetical protein SARC_02050 [Sphaeroforma arctica JP610]